MDKETTVPEVRRSGRLYYLDWIRIIALAGVIFVHSTNISGDWFDQPLDLGFLTLLLVFLAPAGISVFFLVSGSSSMFALDHRSSSEFLKERLLRLAVPFLFFSAVITPYLFWLANQAIPNAKPFSVKETTLANESSFWDVSTYIEFMGYVFTEAIPSNFYVVPPFTPGWTLAIGGHLWFLAFLFAFSVVGLPVLQWLRSGGGRGLVDFAARLAVRRVGLILLALPIIVIGFMGDVMNVVLGIEGLYTAWGNFFRFFAIFLLGGLLFCDQRMVDAVRQHWPWVLCGAVVGFAGFWVASDGRDFVGGDLTAGAVVAQGLFLGVMQWCLALLFLRVGMAFLNRGGRGLRYCLGISVAAYVLHYPVIATVDFLMVTTFASTAQTLLSVGAWLVWLVVLVTSLTILWLIIEFIVRPIPPLRFLLGVPRRRLPSPPTSGVKESTPAK